MSSWKVLSTLAVLSPVLSFATCVGVWSGPTGAHWSNPTGTDWSLSGSCTSGVGVWPGQSGTTDTATFPVGPTVPLTVSLDVIPTINSLTFNNNTANPAYTITNLFGEYLIFGGSAPILNDQAGTQILNTPIVLNLTSDTLTIAVVNAGDTLTLQDAVTDTGTSSISLGTVAHPNSGTLVNNHSILINGNLSLNGGTFTNNGGATAVGALTIGGPGLTPTVINSNISSSSPACNSPFMMGGSITIASGSVTINSDSSCSPYTTIGGTAAYIGGNGFDPPLVFNITGGTIAVTNGATINSSGATTGSTGAEIAGSVVTISGGSVVMTNTGTIAVSPSTNPNNIGVFLYSYSTTNAPLTISGGTVTLTNNGAVYNGAGVNVLSGLAGTSESPITVSSGSLTMTNAYNQVTGLGTASGGAITGSALTVSGGSFTLTNTGNLSVGRGINTNLQNMTVSGGTATLLNGTLGSPNTNGSVNGTALQGVRIFLNDVFNQTGGTLSVTNAGTINAGVGVSLHASGQETFSGGIFNNTNSGNVTVGGATLGNIVGCYFLGSAPMVLSGTDITLYNMGSISPVANGATGSLLNIASTISTSGSGGMLSLTNSGMISGNSSNSGAQVFSTVGMTLGAGLWTATNTGIITGGTGVQIQSGGIIELGGAFNLTMTNSAAVSGTGYGGQLIAASTLDLTGSSSLTLLNNATLTGSGGVGVQATVGGLLMASGTLTVNNIRNLSGSASGAGLNVIGGSFNQTGGTINVMNSGTNTGTGYASYIQSSPTITLSGGTFNNNALVAATAVTVNSGGLLQSTGTFQDDAFGNTTTVTNSGGTFVSGSLNPNTPGATIVDGNFTQSSGIYTVVIGNLNLSGNQGISFLTDTGSVTLDGGTLNVVPAAGFNFATDAAGLESVQFIQASSITGKFTKITSSIPQLGGLLYETKFGNQGWLLFNSIIPPSPTTTPIIPSSTPVLYQPIAITTINFLNTFITRQLIGMNIGDNEGLYVNSEEVKKPRKKTGHKAPFISQAMPQNPRTPSPMIAASKPIVAAADPLFGFINYQTQTKQQQLAERVERNIKPWNVYFGPIGDVGSVNNRHSQLGANYWYVGGLAGFDYAFSQVGLGILVDYENITAKVHKHGGNFGINQFHATAYMTYVPRSLPEFALNTLVGSGEVWYNIHRNILDLPTKERTHGKSRGAEVDALIGMQYTFAHRQFANFPCHLEIIPMINAQYIYQGVGSYKEHGAGEFNLKFHKQGFQSLRTTLGTWLQYTWSWNNFSFTPLVDIGWQREFLDRHHKVRATPIEIEGATGSITIFGAGRDTLLAGLDLLFEFYDTYGIEASYDFEYNRLYRNNGFYIGFNVKF